MTRFVEVPLDNGMALIVQQSPEDEGEIVRAGRIRDVAGLAGESFDSALLRLRSAAEQVSTAMRGVSVPPSEVTVEFAIKVGTSAGVVVANTSAEANLKVALRWTNAPGAEPPADSGE
ncbi:CU044_2847 family protein [Nonomuraea sp. B12E4]|uniref:CU044_2847 family protein n=1 Tax=Nonomuraea sp. B12E4 TaxID=3153564 RepID=UPI00325D2C28